MAAGFCITTQRGQQAARCTGLGAIVTATGHLDYLDASVESLTVILYQLLYGWGTQTPPPDWPMCGQWWWGSAVGTAGTW